jgi:hypothetical protein
MKYEFSTGVSMKMDTLFSIIIGIIFSRKILGRQYVITIHYRKCRIWKIRHIVSNSDSRVRSKSKEEIYDYCSGAVYITDAEGIGESSSGA